jgi:hypothetical protein
VIDPDDARERRWQAFREAHRAEIERVARFGSFLDWRALGARLQAEFDAAERVLEELSDRSG